MTLCPGRRQSGAPDGSWDRDLDADLRAICDTGAVALVTLMEERELKAVGISPVVLSSAAAALGLEWHHLPIPDQSVPNEEFDLRWTYSGIRLRAHLWRGNTAVLHCLGGVGRSGTVTARLLVDLGVEPDAALRSVRAARPGAVERPEQEQHVRHSRRLANLDDDKPLAERALACLLGGAVGDAFGYAVEFDNLDRIRSRFGPDGIREPLRSGGSLTVSDDTQMTLFTLEGLLDAMEATNDAAEGEIVRHIREAYLDWLDTQSHGSSGRELVGRLAREPALRVPRAPGNTCLGALRRGGDGQPERAINDSKGCGAVMRVAPIGLLPRRFDAEEAFRLAARAGALTHGHPSGYLSAGALAATVRLLVDGIDLNAAAHGACAILETWSGHQETLSAIGAALDAAALRPTDHTVAVRSLGEGWVGEEALSIGLYAALSATSFGEAMRIAVNHDGDSDSTASIAGQLWGAWHGIASIPHDWILALDVLRPSLHLARRWLRQLVDDDAAHPRPT